MAKLVCQSGPNAGHEHPLTKERNVFGRQGDCDGQIPDSKASREHFCIQRHENIWCLSDLKSRNGTRLNGSKMSERILEFGDCISVGKCEYIFTAESGDKSLGDLLSKYELDGRIGQGGMGIVYKALQRSMDRIVALKILAPKFSAKSSFIDQFIREARAAGALNHPNIIQVHDVGTENGVHYFSMEYVDGPTCLHVLRNEGCLSPGQALEIIRQTAKALDYAHEHKLIHRDIKPDNIMLANGDTVKLADLGISKTFDEIEHDDSKKIVGTPHYIAPEAAKGQKIDHRVDIYSLGATLYHMLSGQTPYQGNAPTDILKQLLKEKPTDIQELNPEIPDSVATVLEKMMAKDPNDRYGSAMDLIKDVEQVQNSGDVEAKKPGDGETIILRRLASGNKGADQGGPETSYTTNHTSADVAQQSHTTLAASTRSFNPVQLILSLIIVGALGIIGYTLLSKTETAAVDPINNGVVDNDNSDDSGASPDDDSDADNDSADVDHILQEKERERTLSKELDALSNRIRKATALGEIAPINNDIQGIRDQADLPRMVKIKLQSVQQQLDNSLKELKQNAANDALKQLSTEVQKLTEDYEYQTAIRRIDAVDRQHAGLIRSRTDSLKQDVKQQETLFRSRLERQIKNATRENNRDLLKEIRNTLPPSFIDSDIAKSINKALGIIDSKDAKSRQTVMVEAEKFIAQWQLSSARNYYNETAQLLKDSKTASAQYKALDDHAAKLQEMMDAIDKGLKPRETYRGNIKHLTNPYLNGADESSLHVLMDNGGQVKVPWIDLNREILENILGLAGLNAEDYKAALDVQEDAAKKHVE